MTDAVINRPGNEQGAIVNTRTGYIKKGFNLGMDPVVFLLMAGFGVASKHAVWPGFVMLVSDALDW